MNNQSIELKKMLKRVGITILCCLPILVILGYLMRNVNRVVNIIVFVIFLTVAVIVVEYISAKNRAKKDIKKKILHKDEDVYK